MKASDARSENLDGGIDADLTHDRQSILDKFTTSWFQFLLENSLQCWVSYGTIWTSSPIEGPLCLHNLHSLLCQAKRFWLQVLQFLWCQTGQRDLLGGCFLAWIENIAESPHDFMSIVLRLAAGLVLSSLEIHWQLSFSNKQTLLNMKTIRLMKTAFHVQLMWRWQGFLKRQRGKKLRFWHSTVS